MSDGFQPQLSRFIVGIDLGTTNSAVAFVDSSKSTGQIEIFPIEQWVDFAAWENRSLLPSFHYQTLPEEQASLLAAGQAGTSATSTQQVVGVLARDRGMQLPGRQIVSAKSWLSHAGVDRQGPILPWQGDEGVDKLSPVEVSASYLSAIRASWDKAHKRHPLAEQEIVLTLPASFDQIARQLTVDAARLAGLPRSHAD